MAADGDDSGFDSWLMEKLDILGLDAEVCVCTVLRDSTPYFIFL